MITFGTMDFEVGNMTLVAMQEELFANVINDFVDWVRDYRDNTCTEDEVWDFFLENEIDYCHLPQYLKDKIDEIDIV